MTPNVTRFHGPFRPGPALPNHPHVSQTAPIQGPPQAQPQSPITVVIDPVDPVSQPEEPPTDLPQHPAGSMYTWRSVAEGACLGAAIGGLVMMSDDDHPSPWAAVVGGAVGGIFAYPPARAAMEYLLHANRVPD